jgi:hypothetical protein
VAPGEVSKDEAIVDQTAVKVLRDNPRAVLALRAGYRDSRLGLMLGAGLTRAFEFHGKSPPRWGELITKIEDDLKFDSTSRAYQRLSPTQRVDILFRHFLRTIGLSPGDPEARSTAVGLWRDKIRGFVYEGAPPEGSDLLASHPYLPGILDLVLKSPLTITYNFDSFLEEALLAYPVEDRWSHDVYRRPYESVTDVTVPQRRARAVIYHINGYLPRSSLETASDQLVFSEGEFSTQLMMTMAGRYATIAHHLVNNVYLLVGLSLEDPNLRQLLHANALASPGRIHFIVRHVDEPRELTTTDRGIAESGFDLHNLYSLYLTSEEIGALMALITMPDFEFGTHARAGGVDRKQVFYLSGIPGIGKTTVLRHLAGLQTLDEWVEEAHPLLSEPHDSLSKGQREQLDRWIAHQFELKNQVLRNFHDGMYLVERGPLDPLAFEQPDRVARKAQWYASQLDVGRAPLEPGHVFMLNGDTSVVERRIAGRQVKVQEAGYLDQLQTQMKRLYGPACAGLSDWRSTEWTIEDLVKRVATRIYQDDATALDVQGKLDALGASAQA